MPTSFSHTLLTQSERWPSPPWDGPTLCLCWMGRAVLHSEEPEGIQLTQGQAILLSSHPCAVEAEDSLVLVWESRDSTYPIAEIQAVGQPSMDVLERMLDQPSLGPGRIQATLNYLSFELEESSETDSPETFEASVRHYLVNHLAADLHLEDAAREFGMSRTGFLRQCREKLGTSPMKYLAELRVHHAKALLQQPGFTISQVGYQVGYDSPSTFSHFFKRSTGMSPREYRSNCEWLI